MGIVVGTQRLVNSGVSDFRKHNYLSSHEKYGKHEEQVFIFRRVTMDAELITGIFEINYNVIKQQVDGLTHEDSLLQLPFRGNCLNWVLGHILVSRNRALTLIGDWPGTTIWVMVLAATFAALPGARAVTFTSAWPRVVMICAPWRAVVEGGSTIGFSLKKRTS